MAPAAGDGGAEEGGGRPLRRGIGRSTDAAAEAGQDLEAAFGSRKRKAAVMSRHTGCLVGNGAHLNATCEDSQRISNEIKDLRAQLDEDVKELRYCEANKKLRVELALKEKEIQCLRKHREEMQAKYEGMRKPSGDLQAKNEGLAKHNEELQANNDRLVKENEREKGDVFARMLQLEKELLEKQQSELEVARLNGRLQVMKHLEGYDDGDIHENMEKLSERLEHEKKRLEDLSGDLVRKERASNDEGLEDELNGQTAIGVKRMGELDDKPFKNACRRKYGNDDYLTKAAELVSSWQEELKKPSWHPFKVVQVHGEAKEVLDDDDAKLKYLWIEYGDDVCNAVKTALMEINKYNPSGRCGA